MAHGISFSDQVSGQVCSGPSFPAPTWSLSRSRSLLFSGLSLSYLGLHHSQINGWWSHCPHGSPSVSLGATNSPSVPLGLPEGQAQRCSPFFPGCPRRVQLLHELAFISKAHIFFFSPRPSAQPEVHRQGRQPALREAVPPLAPLSSPRKRSCWAKAPAVRCPQGPLCAAGMRPASTGTRARLGLRLCSVHSGAQVHVSKSPRLGKVPDKSEEELNCLGHRPGAGRPVLPHLSPSPG